MMKKSCTLILLYLLIIVAFTLHQHQHQHQGQHEYQLDNKHQPQHDCKNESIKIKALLYPYLPTSLPKNSSFVEYQTISALINEMLIDKGINVEVAIGKEKCNLYDAVELTKCFDNFDIVQLDISLLANVQKIVKQQKKFNFLKWSEKDLKSYFNQVYEFQWSPSKRIDEQTNETFFIASPGLMCSDFIQALNRKDEQTDQYLQKAYDGYSYPTLYAAYYLNKYPNQNLDTMNYTINDEVFAEFQTFFLQCQPNQQNTYNQSYNYCTNNALNQFFNIESSKSSKTTGYSEALFDFWKNFKGKNSPYQYQSHIMRNKSRRLAYLDQFVAKDLKNKKDRQTILDFNKFMISDQVLDIYTQGKYLSRLEGQGWSNYTYLLPPTKAYFQNLGKNGDQNYKKLYQLFTFADKDSNTKAQYIPVYGEIYFNKSQNLTNDIIAKLSV